MTIDEILGITILILIGVYVLLSITLVGFAGIMNLKRLRDNGELTNFQNIVAWPAIIILIGCDWLVNIILTAPLFRTHPRPNKLFSDTLKHFARKEPGSWQSERALWWGSQLEKLDFSGGHTLGG